MNVLSMYQHHLEMFEKTPATIEKYTHDVRCFLVYVGLEDLMKIDSCKISKDQVLAYKQKLIAEKNPATVNASIAALNSFFKYIGCNDLLLNTVKTQKKVYTENELTMEEYKALLAASSEKIKLIIESLASTGIRISELEYFTVERVRFGKITVRCKSKIRTIMLPEMLRTILLDYCETNGIDQGPIFRTVSGKPLNRSNIWRCLKKACYKAGVDPGKVYPHNFRKLFAREFYKTNGDLAKLADVLGHSNINTTRIYIMSSGAEHQKIIDGLGMVSAGSHRRKQVK